MQKVKCRNLTAGILLQNFKEKVKSLIADDEALKFMTTLKGSPAYWKRFQLELLAIVKQLGLLPCFITISSADLRWIDDLFNIMHQLNENDFLTDKEIQNMHYFDRTKVLDSNLVLLTRHFQYRVKL